MYTPPENPSCGTCGKEGYGAGPCASCSKISCYGCARSDFRDINKGRAVEFWFCPECFAAKAPPTAWEEWEKQDSKEKPT